MKKLNPRMQGILIVEEMDHKIQDMKKHQIKKMQTQLNLKESNFIKKEKEYVVGAQYGTSAFFKDYIKMRIAKIRKQVEWQIYFLMR